MFSFSDIYLRKKKRKKKREKKKKLNVNVKVFATYAHWASQPNTVHYKDSHFYVSKRSCVICFVSLLCAFFLVGWVARCVEKVKIREKN